MVPNTRTSLSLAVALSLIAVLRLTAQNPPSQSVPVKSSYQFPTAEEDFSSLFKRTSGDQPEVHKRQMSLLNERYDLSDRPDPNAKQSRGKPVQTGVRVKLSAGVSWDQLSASSPEDIDRRDYFRRAFSPCPIPRTVKEAWSFRILRLMKSRSRPEETWRVLTLTSTYPTTSFQNFPQQFI